MLVNKYESHGMKAIRDLNAAHQSSRIMASLVKTLSRIYQPIWRGKSKICNVEEAETLLFEALLITFSNKTTKPLEVLVGINLFKLTKSRLHVISV